MQIWYNNVPHIKLANVKGHQNWVKASGEFLTFPGGGTQFKNGALYYIDFIQNVSPCHFSVCCVFFCVCKIVRKATPLHRNLFKNNSKKEPKTTVFNKTKLDS